MSINIFAKVKGEGKRDAFFDNMKFIMIFLVFFGHMIRLYIDDNDLLRAIYVYIYFFHIPIFVYLSGFFSKNAKKVALCQLPLSHK